MTVALSKLIHHDALSEQLCKHHDPRKLPVNLKQLCDAVMDKDPECSACRARNSIMVDWCRGFAGPEDRPIIIVGMQCEVCSGSFTTFLYMHEIVGE